MKTSDKIILAVLSLAGLATLGYGVVKYSRKPEVIEPVHLTILHLNDTHSNLDRIRGGSLDGRGGLIERAQYIDSVRAADGADSVLLLHAGDFVQGTVYFTEFDGAAEIAALNGLGYDAITLGNHEFDRGIEWLDTMLVKLNMPVVVCNYDFSPFPCGKVIKPYTILEKSGKKIGIIGVLCNLKSMVAGTIADRIPEYDVFPTVQRYADELRRQKCDLIIALTHIGYEEHSPGELTDVVLCRNTRNIDIFVGGHSHTFLDEAKMHPNKDGKLIPIVQDGCWGANIGQLDVTF